MMDFNGGIGQLEDYKKQLLAMLTPEQQKQALESMNKMSVATTTDELEELKNQEIKKYSDVGSDSTKKH